MPIGAIIGGVASIGGSLLASSANKKAINRATAAQQQSAAEQTALTRDIYNQNKALFTPSIERGDRAGEAIFNLLGLGGDPTAQRNAFDAFRNSTDYQFRLGEGRNAINADFSSKNVFHSGARDKALLKYGQNFGSNEFGNYMGYLGNQQGAGISGMGALAGVGTNFNTTMNNISQNNANALATAAGLKAQNTNSMWSGIASGIGGIFGSSYGK